MEAEERKGPPPVGLPDTRINSESADPDAFEPMGPGQEEFPGKLPPYPGKFAEFKLTHPSKEEFPDPKFTTRI